MFCCVYYFHRRREIRTKDSNRKEDSLPQHLKEKIETYALCCLMLAQAKILSIDLYHFATRTAPLRFLINYTALFLFVTFCELYLSASSYTLLAYYPWLWFDLMPYGVSLYYTSTSTFFFLFKLFLSWLRNLRDAQALKANTNEPFIFGKEFFRKNSGRNVCGGKKVVKRYELLSQRFHSSRRAMIMR